jgi:hypothetical protein
VAAARAAILRPRAPGDLPWQKPCEQRRVDSEIVGAGCECDGRDAPRRFRPGFGALVR